MGSGSAVGGVLFGGAFATIGLGVGIAFFVLAGREAKPLDELSPFSEARAESVQSGQPVLLETTVHVSNKPNAHGLVVGCEEYYRSSTDDSDWQTEEELNFPFVVRYGEVELTVNLNSPCPRGDFAEVYDQGNDNHRWTGYRPGDTITVVGEVSNGDPLTIRGNQHYAGTIDAYRGMLRSAQFLGPIFGLFFAAAGAFVIAKSLRKAKQARRTVTPIPPPSAVAPAQWPGPPPPGSPPA